MLRGNSKVQQRDVIAALRRGGTQLRVAAIGEKPTRRWSGLYAVYRMVPYPSGVTLRHGGRVGDSYNQQAKRNQRGGGASDDS